MVYYHFKLNKECFPQRAEESLYHFFIVYQVNAKSFNSEYIFSFRIFSILKTIVWENKWWWNWKSLVWDSLVLCLLVVFFHFEVLVCRNTTVLSTINLHVPISISVYSVFKSLLERWCVVCWILHALKKKKRTVEIVPPQWNILFKIECFIWSDMKIYFAEQQRNNLFWFYLYWLVPTQFQFNSVPVNQSCTVLLTSDTPILLEKTCGGTVVTFSSQ